MIAKYHGCLKSLNFMKKYRFRGFTNFKKFKFIRLSFYEYSCYEKLY